MTAPPGHHAVSFETDVVTRQKGRYLLYLPEGYGDEPKAWPMILFLHGIGERGTDLNLVRGIGLAKRVDQRPDLPFIVVSPQCPKDGFWDPAFLIGLVDEVIDRYGADPDRVYATGLSMGGYGTWLLAAQYPDRLAAAAPICGGGNPFSAGKLKHLPIWAFHGDADGVVHVSQSQEMVEAVKEHGGDARLTIYPGVGHDSWTRTYDDPAFYEWFLQHRRRG